MPVDFGIYHHSSREESEKLRNISKIMFIEAFKKLGYNGDEDINILDAGAGSGFVTYVTASYFKNAEITDLDNFSGSLIDNSIERLENNLRELGIYNRINIINDDLLNMKIKNNFDLVVSNLVLHNLGRRRFIAYKNIKMALRCTGHFINADGFIRKNIFVEPLKKDVSRISDIFDVEFAMEPSDQKKNAPWRYILVCMRPIC
ncbi:class I SAM-dependent methyltransferase [Picrophilus oshimae]|uniref:Methyltransferase domain-containing protein n=1 Tax=Picrophilus torridus (strain ATCC 700027 / DSM 9790 / JCM 10055 / NBRC 100828 / KAW 2/3) TaxID=1122961 RepID=A0A8G2FXU8_PICTO|nr:class I SAM-dependent methyltransferase [Picrophilus oshimae]SMD31492.1 Methyltransferase domain-containing protein [Picrophilus oshimae DSM 9789]